MRTFVPEGMASPQVENGFTRVANELLEALCQARLGGREMRVVLAVIRLTYGFSRKENAISLGKLAEVTGLKRERLWEVVKALERKRVLQVSKESGRLVLGLQNDYSQWVSQKGVSQKRGTPSRETLEPQTFHGRNTPKMGLSQKRGTLSAQSLDCQGFQEKASPKGVSHFWGIGCPKKGEQGVPKKGNTDPPQSLEPQTFHGTLKKIYKENYKETSSIYREEDFKEVVSRWEEIFGEAFPAERTQESIRAADFMLFLYERGRLPAVKRPSAYLRKLASSELEPFPSLSERRAQARAAEERMQELDRRELARIYAQMVKTGFPASKVPEEIKPLVG